ncbi:MAG: hypothetical protein U0R49_12755 [Fimbriimonadales bacterium]
MAQESSGMDVPVMVGAAVVGLIALGIFYFTKADPVKPGAPVEPAKGAPTVTAAAPVMKDTKGTVGTDGGGGGAGGSGAVGSNPQAGVRKGPVVTGG